LIIANDESGSMTKFAGPREDALSALLDWAPRNLLSSDQLAVITFAGTASVTIAPTNIGAQVVRQQPEPLAQRTNFTPVLAAVGRMPTTSCTTAVVLLSDGLFDDLPADDGAGRAALRAAGVDQLYFLVPGKDIEYEPRWPRLFPYAPAVQFDGSSSDETALSIGRTLAAITGQRLTRTF
jgi:hypothetical protein